MGPSGQIADCLAAVVGSCRSTRGGGVVAFVYSCERLKKTSINVAGEISGNLPCALLSNMDLSAKAF